MKILASLGRGLGNWLGVPSRESLGLSSIGANLPAANLSLPGVGKVRLATAPAAKTSVPGLTPSRRAELDAIKADYAACTAADGMTHSQRLALLETQMRTDFRLDEKLLGVAPKDSLSIRAEFAKYRNDRLSGITPASLPKVVASLPIVASLAPAAPAPSAKAATPSPAVDDDGTAVPTPEDQDDEPTLADIIPGAIKSLEELLETLKEQLPDESTAGDDEEQAKATAALAKGRYAEALSITAGRLKTIGGKHHASLLKGPARAAADSRWFSKIQSKAAHIPALDLPADPHGVRPSAAINEKYRIALAALDSEISVCVAKGRPISQELLARRNTVNREWIAINRRKN
jgi:hypothetical protein